MNEKTNSSINTDRILTRQEHLATLMRTLSQQLVRRSGKHPGKIRILRMLCQNESLTQQEIQEHLAIQSGSVSEIIAKMESLGLISRERHPADRRKYVIRITDAGRRELAEHDIRRHRRQDILYGKLTAEEQDELISLLSKLKDIWSTLPTDLSQLPDIQDNGGTSS